MSSNSEDEPTPIGWATNDGIAVSDSPTIETRAIPVIAHDRTRDPSRSRVERDTIEPFWILPENGPQKIRDVPRTCTSRTIPGRDHTTGITAGGTHSRERHCVHTPPG